MYLITHKTANCWSPPNSFQKTIVNILIGSLGIWMCQRGQHHQMVPPPPPCISLTLLIFEGAICPPHPHCWLSLLEFGKPKRKEKQRLKSTLHLACAKACSYSTSLPVSLFLQQRMQVATCFSPLQKFPPFIPLSLLRLFPLSSSVELPSDFFEYIYRCQETVLTTEA